MRDTHNRVHIASGIEISFELHPNRLTGHHKIIQDPIGYFLMGNRPVAVTIDIELDRLELNHFRPRLIEQPEHSEVGIPRKGTQASELWQFDRDLVGPSWARVLEADQFCIGNRPLAI